MTGVLIGEVTAGSWAEWASATGTVGALIASLLLLRHEIASRRADDLERRSEGRSSQARSISCWPLDVVAAREVDEDGRLLAGLGGNSSVQVAIMNSSKEPVFNAIAYVRFNYSADAGSMGSFPHLIPPDSTRVIWVDGVTLPPSGLAGLPNVELVFRDVDARDWVRTHSGHLREISHPHDWVDVLRSLPNDVGGLR